MPIELDMSELERKFGIGYDFKKVMQAQNEENEPDSIMCRDMEAVLIGEAE